MVMAAPKPAPYCAETVRCPLRSKLSFCKSGKSLRVYQCQNCAKVIWSE